MVEKDTIVCPVQQSVNWTSFCILLGNMLYTNQRFSANYRLFLSSQPEAVVHRPGIFPTCQWPGSASVPEMDRRRAIVVGPEESWPSAVADRKGPTIWTS